MIVIYQVSPYRRWISIFNPIGISFKLEWLLLFFGKCPFVCLISQLYAFAGIDIMLLIWWNPLLIIFQLASTAMIRLNWQLFIWSLSIVSMLLVGAAPGLRSLMPLIQKLPYFINPFTFITFSNMSIFGLQYSGCWLWGLAATLR